MNASKVTRFALINLCLALPMFAGCSADSTEPGAAGPDVEEPAPEVGELRAKIGPAGGELVGAAGSAFAGFRLVVPAGALASETDVVVRASVEPVPLALTAERVGPQFSIEPAGLALAAPAKLTVPFDPTLRAEWAQADGDCKVWLRDGAGWTSAEQTAVSPEGVTVDVRTLTVAAAGISVKALSFSCAVTNSCPTTTSRCLSGANFCLTRLTPPTVSAFATNNLTVDNGFAYFVHSPAANTFTIAKYNLLSATGETTLLPSFNVTPSGPVSLRGRIALGTNGEAWASMVGYGNVRFRPGVTPSRFDAATTIQPAGVVINDADRTVIARLTRRGIPFSGCNLESGGCGFHLDGQTNGNLVQIDTLTDTELVFARSRPGGGAEPFAFIGTDKGVGAFAVGSGATRKADPCGASASVSVDLGPSGLRRIACNNGHVFDDDGKDYTLGVVVSSMATDHATGLSSAYIVDASRAELIQIHGGIEGGQEVKRYPLTSAAAGTPEHDRMLPRAIRFEKNTNTLVLVTRGIATNGIPEFYTIDNLGF